jgi:hypothetical protein
MFLLQGRPLTLYTSSMDLKQKSPDNVSEE